jgi:hypothetical protein
MMRRLLPVLLVIGLAGCGGVTEKEKDGAKGSNFNESAFPKVNGTIYGAWEAIPVSGRHDYRLFFNRSGQFGVESVCDSEGGVRASGVGNVNVKSRELSFLSGVSAKAQDEKGNDICIFIWPAFTTSYWLSNDTLTITTSPDGSGGRSFRRYW